MEFKKFTYEPVDTALIVHMPQEVDHHNCEKLRLDTDFLLSETYVERLVFDFTRTTFMDSSGIGLLLNRGKQMRLNRGKTFYYGAGSQVKRILEIGGINRLFAEAQDKQAALGNIKGQEKEGR